MAEELIDETTVEDTTQEPEETTTPTLYDEILAELKLELENENGFDEDALKIKVKNAIREVRKARKYSVSGYSDEKITDDLYNFYSNILNLARYDYNMIGGEGEKSHTENGVTRSFVDRGTFLKGVIPFSVRLN